MIYTEKEQKNNQIKYSNIINTKIKDVPVIATIYLLKYNNKDLGNPNLGYNLMLYILIRISRLKVCTRIKRELNKYKKILKIDY